MYITVNSIKTYIIITLIFKHHKNMKMYICSPCFTSILCLFFAVMALANSQHSLIYTFSFSVFTTFLNLHSLIFGLTFFGWLWTRTLPSVYKTHRKEQFEKLWTQCELWQSPCARHFVQTAKNISDQWNCLFAFI